MLGRGWHGRGWAAGGAICETTPMHTHSLTLVTLQSRSAYHCTLALLTRWHAPC